MSQIYIYRVESCLTYIRVHRVESMDTITGVRVRPSRIQSCNTLQHTCNTLQHTATHCNNLQNKRLPELGRREFRAATYCSTPATLCSTLQHTATTYKARGCQSWDVENSELQHTAAHLQHSAAHCNTLQQLTKQEATRVGTSRILHILCVCVCVWERKKER